jgi:putative sterol carrier protein
LTGDYPLVILLTEQLAQRTIHEERPMSATPQQVFDAMPAAFRPAKAGTADLALQFILKGDLGGEWSVRISNGTCNVSSDRIENPTATIRTSAEDFGAIFDGSLNAVAAYMSGRVQVDGDVTGIMNLLSFFEMPT